MEGWKTLSRKTVLDLSPYLTVETHAVELPDGRVIPDWPWVITPDYVNVVALTAEGRFVCFRRASMPLRTRRSRPWAGMSSRARNR